jgi:hypothetical protein
MNQTVNTHTHTQKKEANCAFLLQEGNIVIFRAQKYPISLEVNQGAHSSILLLQLCPY